MRSFRSSRFFLNLKKYKKAKFYMAFTMVVNLVPCPPFCPFTTDYKCENVCVESFFLYHNCQHFSSKPNICKGGIIASGCRPLYSIVAFSFSLTALICKLLQLEFADPSKYRGRDDYKHGLRGGINLKPKKMTE